MSGLKPDLISDFPGVEVVGSSGGHEFSGRVMGCKSFFSGFIKYGQSFLKGGEESLSQSGVRAVRDASPTQMYSFLLASWAGDTHEETDVLPIGD